MMKGDSSLGTMIQGIIHKLLKPTTPQDKGSALLATDRMYVGVMDKLVVARQAVILQRDLWPFQKDEITEVLSQ